MADDIRELNALIADYGREFQSPDPRRGPSLGSSRLYADYQPATSIEQAEMVLSMLPGVGEGLDVAYIAQGIEEKDARKAGTGLAALLLPGVGAGVIKKIGENLPKHKQGLRSINIDDEDVLKTPEGDPVILYRGLALNDDIADAALSGKSRDDYATFMSDSPHVAASYAGKLDPFIPDDISSAGAVAPFVVKPKKVIEYKDQYTRQNKDRPGSSLSFSKFEFDRQAQNLGPGEVLVARDVVDIGPRAVVTGPDDPKYFSYASDVYATRDPSILQSPFSAKEVSDVKKSGKPVIDVQSQTPIKITLTANAKKQPTIKPVDELKKHDNLEVPFLNDPDKKLIQQEMPLGMHQLSSKSGEFYLVGGRPEMTSPSGYGKVLYAVVDETGQNAIGRVTLRRKVGEETATGIDGIVNIEIDPKYRKKGYAKKILDSLRASTDNDAPFMLYDIINPKFFKSYAKDMPSAKVKTFRRGGSVVERSNKHEPKAI